MAPSGTSRVPVPRLGKGIMSGLIGWLTTLPARSHFYFMHNLCPLYIFITKAESYNTLIIIIPLLAGLERS